MIRNNPDSHNVSTFNWRWEEYNKARNFIESSTWGLSYLPFVEILNLIYSLFLPQISVGQFWSKQDIRSSNSEICRVIQCLSILRIFKMSSSSTLNNAQTIVHKYYVSLFFFLPGTLLIDTTNRVQINNPISWHCIFPFHILFISLFPHCMSLGCTVL